LTRVLIAEMQSGALAIDGIRSCAAHQRIRRPSTGSCCRR